MRFINRVSDYPNKKILHVSHASYSNGELSELHVTEEKDEGTVTVTGTELNAENLNKAFEEFGRNRFLCIYAREDEVKWTTDKILLHEYGHYIQLTTYGFGLYFLCIGIPSFINNDQNLPWEISADLLGGVQRPYNSDDVVAGKLYYLLTSLLGLSYHGGSENG